MKQINLLFALIFMGAALVLSCSQKKGIGSKIEKDEMQIIATKDALRQIDIKMEDYLKLVHKVDSLKSDLEKTKLLITNDWFKGMDKPYEKILMNLTKQGYDLTNYQNGLFEPVPKGLLVILKNNWNTEEVGKVKEVIAKTIPSGPEVVKDSVMKWIVPQYDVEIVKSKTDSVNYIGLFFLLK